MCWETEGLLWGQGSCGLPRDTVVQYGYAPTLTEWLRGSQEG